MWHFQDPSNSVLAGTIFLLLFIYLKCRTLLCDHTWIMLIVLCPLLANVRCCFKVEEPKALILHSVPAGIWLS